LKSQRDFLDREATSLDIAEAKGMRTKLEDEIHQGRKLSMEMLERTERNNRIIQLQHSLDWLSVNDKVQEMEYERLSNRRYDQTCQWVTSATQIKAWMKKDTKCPLLWINGKPGAGKSKWSQLH
jgi:hypothetical protein